MLESTDSTTRRNVLKLTGASLTAVGSVGVASADHEHPDVETVGSYQNTYESFTLYGDLLDIGDSADYASVWFEWGPKGDGFTDTTHPEVMYSTGEFSDTVSGMERGDYQFRAAAKDSDDYFTFYGDTRYFEAGNKK